jgi:hypothetical protein
MPPPGNQIGKVTKAEDVTFALRTLLPLLLLSSAPFIVLRCAIASLTRNKMMLEAQVVDCLTWNGGECCDIQMSFGLVFKLSGLVLV